MSLERTQIHFRSVYVLFLRIKSFVRHRYYSIIPPTIPILFVWSLIPQFRGNYLFSPFQSEMELTRLHCLYFIYGKKIQNLKNKICSYTYLNTNFFTIVHVVEFYYGVNFTNKNYSTVNPPGPRKICELSYTILSVTSVLDTSRSASRSLLGTFNHLWFQVKFNSR